MVRNVLEELDANVTRSAANNEVQSKQLPKHVADQCREIGLVVGDTIEGTEGEYGWWNTTRLTLLWLGETEAAWRVTYRSSSKPQWSQPRESTNWSLSLRDWHKIGIRL